MKSVRDLHRQAMDFAEQAFAAKQQGDPALADSLSRQAFEHELRAATAVAPDLTAEPTRSVLYRSAATLALDCGEVREAERLIAVALAGDPPDEIAEELRNLFEQVHFQRHLATDGITLEPTEFQLSIAGKAVGLGIAPLSDLLGRIEHIKKLFFRTAERVRRQPFRERGPIKKALRGDFEFFLSTPRAGSFAVTIRLGRTQDQLRLTETLDTDQVIEELLRCLEMFNNAEAEELKRRFPEEAYHRNFIALARRLAPDGKDIQVVGFSAMRDGWEKQVALTHPPTELVRSEEATALAEAPSGEGETVTVTGALRFADALPDQKRQTIIVVDAQRQQHTFIVPEGMMSDIVRPLWEYTVVVTGQRQGSSIVLLDIGLAPEA
jgi:hypothetical protein